jgi:hypothetical protein
MATTLSDGTVIETPIPDKDFEVQDPNSTDPDHKRLVKAGQPVPPDLLEVYAEATGDKKLAKAVAAPDVNKAVSGPQTSK